jgi:hypothetical protein
MRVAPVWDWIAEFVVQPFRLLVTDNPDEEIVGANLIGTHAILSYDISNAQLEERR